MKGNSHLGKTPVSGYGGVQERQSKGVAAQATVRSTQPSGIIALGDGISFLLNPRQDSMG